MKNTQKIHLPNGLKAFTLLASNGPSMSGMRLGQSLNRLSAGSRTITIKRSQAAMAHLRMVDPHAQEEIRLKQAMNTRVSALRRPNPSDSNAMQIDDRIVDLMVHAVAHEGASPALLIRKEALARFFNVPEHFIVQSLERLNKHGLVGPEHNRAAHDSNRDPWGGNESGWSGSYRYANSDKLLALIQERSATGLLQPKAEDHVESKPRKNRSNGP